MAAEPWGIYPPEINAGRYESGVGPGAWIAAALKWTAMAGLVAESFAALGVQVGTLTGNWEGLASRRFGGASVPFVSWLAEMETIAVSNANACADVVAAWQAGHAAMVPLPIIIINRVAARTAQIAGVLGAPNTEMVRLELEYAAFWAHNATVMTAYDVSANTATAVKPVPPPPALIIAAVPGPSQVADATGRAAMQNQQMASGIPQQFANSAGQFMGMPGNSAYASQLRGPSQADASMWGRLLGSGSGGGAGFGGGRSFGRGGGGGRGHSGGGLAGTGAFAGVMPPTASFAAPSATIPSSSTPAFSGVSNAASATRPPIPMQPPIGPHGANSKRAIPQQDQAPVIAAVQELSACSNTVEAAIEGQEQDSEKALQTRLH